MDWASRHYGNPLLSLGTVLIAAILLMNLSKSVQDTKVGSCLTFFGKASLALMSLHFLCFKVCYIILVILGVYPIWSLKNLTTISEGWWNIFYVILTLCMFYGIHLLLHKLPIYQWIFEGKIPTPKRVKEGVYNKYSIITIFIVLAFL